MNMDPQGAPFVRNVPIVEDPFKGWAEYTTPEGRKYYSNRITGFTSWDKPNELKTTSELAEASTPWKEYVADSGQKYYYNSDTKESMWEEPPEHKAIREAQQQRREEERAEEERQAALASAEAASNGREHVYTDQQDRVRAFMELLDAAGVTSTWTWDMAMRAIINDERYKAIKTLQEKKAILEEFKVEKKKQEREEKKKRENRTRDLFLLMLKESKEIHAKMPWRRALPYFEGDIRLEAIPEREREQIYNDYMEQVDREEKEKAKEARKNNMKAFRELLEKDKTVTTASQWRKIKDQFAENGCFKALDKFDRLAVFEEYMREVEKEEEEKKRLELIEQKKKSRHNRESFRALLQEQYQSGALTMATKWKEFHKTIKEDPRYKTMVESEQLGSLPSELFGDFIEDLEERFENEKKKVRNIIQERNFPFNSKTNYDDFVAAISSHSDWQTIKPINRDIIFSELVEQAERDEKKKEKEIAKKAAKRYKDLLKSTRSISGGSKWADVRAMISSDPIYHEVATEEEREKLFNRFLRKRFGDDSDKRSSSGGSRSHHKRRHSTDRDREPTDDRKRRRD